MINKAFPIDFIRQVIEQTLLEESIKDTTLFGGKNQVNLFSFYEQLQKEDEVNRYVEIYRDLTDQQNRSGLIMNGTIIAPENPTITNLYSHLIIPMSFTCTFRVKLGDRDSAINTINNLIKVLKGKKQDVALFDNGTIFKVGTLGSGDNSNNKPVIHIGDYIGEYELATYNEQIETYLENLINNYNFAKETIEDVPTYYYAKINNKLVVVLETEEEQKWQIAIDNGSEPNIVFPQDHNSFEKFKVSMSFDSIRCDEPRNLNANEYCVISFGGSATLVDMNTRLGNDLVKVGVAKYKVKADPVIEINGNTEWLEPLEQPSSNSANTMNNLLKSSNFLANTHTDSLAVSRQYTFVADYQGIVNEWYNYARYGTRVDNSSITYDTGVSPNLIYKVKELISQWGNVKINTTYCKIIESIDIENTESDVESVVVPLQVQGDIKVYDISVNIENGSFTGNTEIEPSQTRTITLTPFTNYRLPNSITVVGATYTYNSTSGEVALSNPTGNITINAECEAIPTFTINKNITHGTFEGDTTIVENGTATITIVPAQNYLLPYSVSVGGATYTYDNTTGVITMTNPTRNVDVIAMCHLPFPVKTGKIKFAPKSDNVKHDFRVLDITNNGIAKLMDLTEDSGALPFNTTDRKVAFANGQSYQNYKASNVAKYCNQTYWNSLKGSIQLAISRCPNYAQGNTFYQSAYNFVNWNEQDNDVSSSEYDVRVHTYSDIREGQRVYHYYKRITSQSIQYIDYQQGSNYIFALDIDDIRSYFGISNKTIECDDLFEMIGRKAQYGGTTNTYFWLRSAITNFADDSYVIGTYMTYENITIPHRATSFKYYGATLNIPSNYQRVMPCFFIDLNFVDFELGE